MERWIKLAGDRDRPEYRRVHWDTVCVVLLVSDGQESIVAPGVYLYGFEIDETTGRRKSRITCIGKFTHNRGYSDVLRLVGDKEEERWSQGHPVEHGTTLEPLVFVDTSQVQRVRSFEHGRYVVGFDSDESVDYDTFVVDEVHPEVQEQLRVAIG